MTPAKIIAGLASIVDDLGLPHPLHLHCNNLGAPGNVHDHARDDEGAGGPPGPPRAPAVPRLRRRRLGHDALGGGRRSPSTSTPTRTSPPTPGPMLFGNTVTITADGPWQHLLYQLTGRKWGNLDVENETGCGIVPYVYKEKQPRQRRPVGGRAGAAAAHQRPVAGVPDHRPPQRRVLLALPGDHPAADGRGLPQASKSSKLPAEGAEAHRPGGPGPASTRCRRSPSSRRPARRARWGCRRRGTSASGADADVAIYDDEPGRRRACSTTRATSSRAGRSWSRRARSATVDRGPASSSSSPTFDETDRGLPAPAVPAVLHDVVRQLPGGDGAHRTGCEIART